MDCIIDYYTQYSDDTRLSRGRGKLEKARTLSILQRYLPPPPAIIYDIGGGTGVYSFILKEKGYTVHLLDITRSHIEEAKQKSLKLDSYRVGNACSLPYSDNSADIVLLFGPLYHLLNFNERVKALEEAYRVLTVNGLLFVVGISRFAMMMDFIEKGMLSEEWGSIFDRDLKTGQHWNPDNTPGYFTNAYFHLPHELKNEVEEAGFTQIKLIGVEGPVWINGVEPSHQILTLCQQIETEPSLLGANAHIMSIAKK